MNHRYIFNSEVHHHQSIIRQDAHHARSSFSVTGMRRLIGNTFIALGELLYGKQPTIGTRVSDSKPAQAW